MVIERNEPSSHSRSNNRSPDASNTKVRPSFTPCSGRRRSYFQNVAGVHGLAWTFPDTHGFSTLKMTGQRQTIDSADVNAYAGPYRPGLHRQGYAHVGRYGVGSLCPRQLEAFESQTQAKNNVIHAMDVVARQLGNTRAVCRKCYVHPTIIEAYFDRSLFEAQPYIPSRIFAPCSPDQLPEEAVVLTLLKLTDPTRYLCRGGSWLSNLLPHINAIEILDLQGRGTQPSHWLMRLSG